MRRNITQDWKSFRHSKGSAKYRGKIHFVQERNAEKFIDRHQCVHKLANITIPAKCSAYFRRLSCGFPLHFMLCLELSSRVSPRSTYDEQLACMYISCRRTRRDLKTRLEILKVQSAKNPNPKGKKENNPEKLKQTGSKQLHHR